MTRIEFYHNAADKLAAAARLIADAYREGARVLVFAPDRGIAQRLDNMLWTQPALSFVPHVAATSPLAQETPIVIAGSLEPAEVGEHDQVLVNLDGDLPPSFARFERLIEIVGSDDADRAPARARFRFYRDRGYPIETRDLAAR